jgi:hypothetical protein
MLSIVRKVLLLLMLLAGYVSVMGACCRCEDQCDGTSERCDSNDDGTLDGRCMAGVCVADEPPNNTEGDAP